VVEKWEQWNNGDKVKLYLVGIVIVRVQRVHKGKKKELTAGQVEQGEQKAKSAREEISIEMNRVERATEKAEKPRKVRQRAQRKDGEE
jgi:hypothetical protein